MPIVSDGGGGVPIIARAIYSGHPVAIPDGSVASLTWDSLDSGDALLNITTPALPTIMASGVYAFTVNGLADGVTAGGWMELTCDFDLAGEDPFFTGTSTHNAAIVSCTYYLVAGAQVQAQVVNRDGVAERSFSLFASVQRLS